MLRWLALPVSVTFILQDQQSWDVHDTCGGPCSSITGCPVQQGTATVTMPAILCLKGMCMSQRQSVVVDRPHIVWLD